MLLHSHTIEGTAQRKQFPFPASLVLTSLPLNVLKAEPFPIPGLGMGVSQAQVTGHPPPVSPCVSIPHFTLQSLQCGFL